MEATSGRQRSVNDDAAAALRRAVAFAGLFGLTGLAAIACTAKSSQPVSGVAADRLLAQEALWNAEANGAPAITFPSALLARRSDPQVAQAIAAAQHRFAADQKAAAAKRDAVLQRMDDARADRDLHEAQRNVASLKLEQAYAEQVAARQRHDDAAAMAVEPRLKLLKIEVARATGGSARASRTLAILNTQMMTLATAEHSRVARELDMVRSQLRGA